MQSSISEHSNIRGAAGGMRRSSATVVPTHLYFRNNNKQSLNLLARRSMDEDDYIEHKLSLSAGGLQLKTEKERRNSVHLFLSNVNNRSSGNHSRQGSVPAIPVAKGFLNPPRHASLQYQTSIYRSFKQYLTKGGGDQSSSGNNAEQMQQLDDTFAQIKIQLVRYHLQHMRIMHFFRVP